MLCLQSTLEDQVVTIDDGIKKTHLRDNGAGFSKISISKQMYSSVLATTAHK